MAEGASRLAWAQTSAVVAMVANSARDTKKKASPFQPSEFDPWAKEDRRRTPARVQGDIGMLKVFLPQKEG